MYTKKISYSKEFLTGPLAGICVRCSYGTTDDAVRQHERELMGITKLNPGTDLSGYLYWVYNMGCEDVTA